MADSTLSPNISDTTKDLAAAESAAAPAPGTAVPAPGATAAAHMATTAAVGTDTADAVMPERAQSIITPAELVICFGTALLTCMLFRFLFRDKRELWFAQTKSTIFNQRGRLGQYLSLGYPVTLPGLVVIAAEVLLIALECLLIVLLF